MSKKVMPSDIDQHLAKTIAMTVVHYEPQKALTPTPSTYEVQCVLAWLANNPIEPTVNDLELITDDYGATVPYANEVIFQFQRIAYLNKEEPLPQEVKDLLWEQPYVEIGDPLLRKQNESVIKAYRLGKESK